MVAPVSARHAVPLFRLLAGIADAVAIPVTGLALDSRKVRPGDLFLAMPGERHDGRNYLAAVEAAGAVAAVVEVLAFLVHPLHYLRTILCFHFVHSQHFQTCQNLVQL